MLSNAQFTLPAWHDKTVLSVSCLAWTGQLLWTCSDLKLSLGDSLELSGIQFTPQKRTQTQARQFCRVWRGGVNELWVIFVSWLLDVAFQYPAKRLAGKNVSELTDFVWSGTWWASTGKVIPIWISLKQETVSGSGISWAICKSVPCSRQITTPAPHHSVFYRPDALPAAQPTASKHWRHTFCDASLEVTDWLYASDWARDHWSRVVYNWERVQFAASDGPTAWDLVTRHHWWLPARCAYNALQYAVCTCIALLRWRHTSGIFFASLSPSVIRPERRLQFLCCKYASDRSHLSQTTVPCSVRASHL